MNVTLHGDRLGPAERAEAGSRRGAEGQDTRGEKLPTTQGHAQGG